VKQPNATLIGVFVLGAMSLIVAAIVFFGSGRLFKERFAVVSYFHGSVAGLRVGAPVTYRGARVGEVKAIGVVLAADMTPSMVQVNMELVPETVRAQGTTPVPARSLLLPLLERGLSARLVMQSFVTGQLQVELDLRPGMQASRSGVASEVPEIPTVPSPFQALAEQLETLDIAAALNSVQRALGSLDALLANPAVKKTIDDLPALIADTRRTVGTIEREVKGISSTGQRAITESAAALDKTLASVRSLAENVERESVATLGTVRSTAENANTAIDGANLLLDPRGQTVIQLQRAVEDLAATSARLRRFAERVDRDPAVLVRGR